MAGIPLLDQLPVQFPDPRRALPEPDGLLAAGGDLTPDWLVTAYSHGIFPWFNDDAEPIYWWSPSIRGVLVPGNMRITRSFAKRLRNHSFKILIDEHFAQVIQGCAQSPRAGQSGTWITPRMQSAYLELFHHGVAHCVEVWQDDCLVGGLYGIAVGRMFCGESMFSRTTDASKVAFFTLQRELAVADYALIDCQMMNPHLATLGVKEMVREEFLMLTAENRRLPLYAGAQPWIDKFPATNVSSNLL